jgi:hypothetical protein
MRLLGGSEATSAFLLVKSSRRGEGLKLRTDLVINTAIFRTLICTNSNTNMKVIEMVWVLREPEKAAISSQDGVARYKYFIKKVADENQLWSLWKDGWVLAEDDKGRLVVPVWPHAQFAEMCASGDWIDHEARPIEMDAWLDRWLPGILSDNRLIAVFPTANDKGVVVGSEQLAADLRGELQNYE